MRNTTGPKQVWVRELVKRACARLPAPTLPAAWAPGETAVAPRCTAPAAPMRSLIEHLCAAVPEFRRKEALAYPLDGSLEEDCRRVRNASAALVLGMFRRVMVSGAQVWLAAGQTPKTRYSVRRFPKQFGKRDGGAQRLAALAFAKSPTAWRLPK